MRCATAARSRYCAGESTPTHESKSWITSAPAATWAATYPAKTSASRASSASHTRRLAKHERLGLRELAARAALDEVRRHGERPAGKADERLLGGQLATHEPHRLEDGRERLLRIGSEESLDVRHRAHRSLDHRPDALDELDGDAHAEHRGHDVREQHGRVDVVTAHGLQRHLGAELGGAGDLEEAVTLADRAVLGKAAARLAHEPHRGALDSFTAERAHEKRGHDEARVARRS